VLALPWAVLCLPPARELLTARSPTGYDRRGACRLLDLDGLSAFVGRLRPILRSRRVRSELSASDLARLDGALLTAEDYLRANPRAAKEETDRRRDAADALITSVIRPGHPLHPAFFPDRALLHRHQARALAAGERPATRAARAAAKYGVLWQPDASQPSCRLCSKPFTLLRRRHHCRSCGQVVCDSCSTGRRPVPGSPTPKRVCDNCVRARNSLNGPGFSPAATGARPQKDGYMELV